MLFSTPRQVFSQNFKNDQKSSSVWSLDSLLFKRRNKHINIILTISFSLNPWCHFSPHLSVWSMKETDTIPVWTFHSLNSAFVAKVCVTLWRVAGSCMTSRLNELLWPLIFYIYLFILTPWHTCRISPATNQSWSEVWKMKCKFLCSDANFFDICGRGCDRGELRDDAW